MPGDPNADKNKANPDVQAMIALLNDPAYVAAAAQKLGMKIAEPEKAKEAEFIIPSLKPVEVGEGESLQDVLRKLNESLGEFSKGLGSTLKGFQDSLREEVTTKAEEPEQARIRRFLSEKEKAVGEDNWKKLFPVMNTLYKGGSTVEEAYQLAMKASGVEEPGTERKTEKASTSDTFGDTSRRSAIGSSDATDTDNTKTTHEFKTVRDAAQKNLNDLIAKEGEGVLE